jgi:hypothetical protein
MSLAFNAGGWIELLAQNCIEIIEEHETDPAIHARAEQEIGLLAEFVTSKLAGVLDAKADLEPRSMASPYDILAWRRSPLGTPLQAFTLNKPVVYDFIFTAEQIKTRHDQFRRYGVHANALSKIVTRVSNVESLFRKIVVRGAAMEESQEREVDLMIRYSLSN